LRQGEQGWRAYSGLSFTTFEHDVSKVMLRRFGCRFFLMPKRAATIVDRGLRLMVTSSLRNSIVRGMQRASQGDIVFRQFVNLRHQPRRVLNVTRRRRDKFVPKGRREKYRIHGRHDIAGSNWEVFAMTKNTIVLCWRGRHHCGRARGRGRTRSFRGARTPARRISATLKCD